MMVLVLVFGMLAVGCDEPKGDEWTNVTSLSQLNGTWKGSYSQTGTEEGFTVKQEMEMTMTINASAGTMSGTQKMTMTFSGTGINEAWDAIKTVLADDGVIFNDSNHSASMTYTIPSTTFTLPDGLQINQNGKKIKLPEGVMGGNPEIIFTKQ